MMTYIKVLWTHNLEHEPVELLSELDGLRHEVRKIERFRNGSLSFASLVETSGASQLSETPLPSLNDIADDPQFNPANIDKKEFERYWQMAQMATAA